jgi:PilZ domain
LPSQKASGSTVCAVEDQKMIENVTTETLAAATINRRRHVRIAGPFDGFRVGALETPLSIFDLSRGGCFVNAMHEQTSGIRFVMKIDLPQVGLIRLKAETLHRRSGFGFAVRFVDMNEETLSRLDEALEQLQKREPYDE